MTADEKKKAAAERALDFVESGSVIGVGTGTTSNHFIEALARMNLGIDAAVASSRSTAERLRRHGIRVVDLAEAESVPLYVDGADEATRTRILLKGGGGALTQEKIVASASARFVCVIDDSKLVARLGKFPLAVEVIPMARSYVAREIARLGGRPVLRQGFVTDNGNMILDVHGLTIDDPLGLESALERIAGIVANGLFCRRRADLLLVGGDEGVETIGPD